MAQNEYQPNIVTPPGSTLRELIYLPWCEALNMEEWDLEKLLNGEIELTVDIAIKLEELTKISANFWLNYEKRFRNSLKKET